MSMNEIYRDGVSLPYPVASTVESGDLVAFASGLVGVAEVDAKVGEDGSTFFATIRHDGVFAIPAGANAGGIGDSALVVTLPSGNIGEAVALGATGTKIGTIVNINNDGDVYVNLNR
jgi:predicted RecA/RadA family phage recombinase